MIKGGESAWGGDTQFFFSLTPERVLEAVETTGLRGTGRCQALNSFENRVYDVELERGDVSSPPKGALPSPGSHPDGGHRVVKFYRPGRWTREQILEEHQFLLDLQEAEVPAVAPLPFPDGSTLAATPEGIFFTIFPKVGGRSPDEFSDEDCVRVGRLLARVHTVGAQRPAPHRVRIGVETYGEANLSYLLERWVPQAHARRYETVVREILKISRPLFQKAIYQRVHGDCHPGNLLQNQRGFFFVDFDDMVQGPVSQDLWLLIAGRDRESLAARALMLEGYEEMRAFDRPSLALIEPLRALRFIHYTAWIARRWEDPAFPKAFPEFNSHAYWEDETQDLESQLEVLLK